MNISASVTGAIQASTSGGKGFRGSTGEEGCVIDTTRGRRARSSVAAVIPQPNGRCFVPCGAIDRWRGDLGVHIVSRSPWIGPVAGHDAVAADHRGCSVVERFRRRAVGCRVRYVRGYLTVDTVGAADLAVLALARARGVSRCWKAPGRREQRNAGPVGPTPSTGARQCRYEPATRMRSRRGRRDREHSAGA